MHLASTSKADSEFSKLTWFAFIFHVLLHKKSVSSHIIIVYCISGVCLFKIAADMDSPLKEPLQETLTDSYVPMFLGDVPAWVNAKIDFFASVFDLWGLTYSPSTSVILALP